MTAYRFTLSECRRLSSRAWQIRRFHAARLCIPVMAVSWRECLVLAKRESLRADLWRLHTAAIQCFGRREPLVGVGVPVCLPAAPVRSSWVSGLARAAVVVLAVLAV